MKVLLLCSPGLIVNYFSNDVNQYAKDHGIRLQVDLLTIEDNWQEYIKDYPLIVLAPQLQYLFTRISLAAKLNKVLIIPKDIFVDHNINDALKFININYALK